MPEPVLNAMTEAARSYVDIRELQILAGRRLAEITGNESAYICNCATAGLFLAALACITRGERLAVARLPSLTGLPTEIAIPRTHRNPFVATIELTGARVIEFGNVITTLPVDLEAALSDRTAAVAFMAGGFYKAGPLTLTETIRIAHNRGIPVIVDAAAEVPPAESLSSYTRILGADLVIFSGGKAIRGPQASGFILGRAELIEACRAIGPPNAGPARALKIGKEEIMGLLAAVDWYLGQDHGATRQRNEQMTGRLVSKLNDCVGLNARRIIRGGQPVPRIELRIDEVLARISSHELEEELAAGNPPIGVDLEPNTQLIYMTPETLLPGEEDIVCDRICQIVHSRTFH